jgi:hypothetical protein
MEMILNGGKENSQFSKDLGVARDYKSILKVFRILSKTNMMSGSTTIKRWAKRIYGRNKMSVVKVRG